MNSATRRTRPTQHTTVFAVCLFTAATGVLPWLSGLTQTVVGLASLPLAGVAVAGVMRQGWGEGSWGRAVQRSRSDEWITNVMLVLIIVAAALRERGWEAHLALSLAMVAAITRVLATGRHRAPVGGRA